MMLVDLQVTLKLTSLKETSRVAEKIKSRFTKEKAAQVVNKGYE